ncbi:MAG TPA: glutathione S-transferase family protein [Burkholderiaceae bacterium]|nr:glutathione S-transferase family protein [Burkholderiaceae bacterium]
MQPGTTSTSLHVYGMASSGNCHKVKLALDILGIACRWHETDIMKGESRTPEFLRMNPNGRVPVLQVDANTFLPESNAILCYLAEGSPLWPGDRLARAQALQWLFFEQYSHEPYIAVARFLRLFVKRYDDPRFPDLMKRGYAALGVMETHLGDHDFFVAGRLTIADIALFAYTHRAGDGGFDMARYPRVRAWIDRCLQQPGMSSMPAPA